MTDDSKFLITGGNGQLGLALQKQYPNARATDAAELDITNRQAVKNFDWSNTSTILNAAAYTNVDGAETPEGKAAAWKVNDEAVGFLADAANEHGLLLVHISTAYVFEGNKNSYSETDQPDPLGEYAKSKAAGDVKAAGAAKHYIIRTDSVIGSGKNFVRIMLNLGQKGIAPTVVSDQIIRPTFATEVARAIKFLIDKPAEFGVYNLTNEGDTLSWSDFTRAIFKEAAINLEVTDTTYAVYSAGKPGIAPRPLNSVLDLAKIESLGFQPHDWRGDLKDYLKKELAK